VNVKYVTGAIEFGMNNFYDFSGYINRLKGAAIISAVVNFGDVDRFGLTGPAGRMSRDDKLLCLPCAG
jgi:hypothetical protein